jgi:PAS domain S-box-containing protein
MRDLPAEEAELRSPTNAEFRLLADHMPGMCWIADASGYIYWYNRRWHEYSGTTPEEMRGWGWQSIHDPAALPSVLENWHRCIATGKPFEMVFPLRSATGEFRPFLTRIRPYPETGHPITHWFGTNIDITAEREIAEHLERVVGELNHRVKNTLAVVQGLAQQSLRDANQPARALFMDRLAALSAAHDLLTNSNCSSATLGGLVGTVMKADCDQVQINGPEILLAPKCVVSLAMVLYELRTNAVKYGALSCPEGAVEITWSVTGSDSREFFFRWREKGGPPVKTPTTRGFGSKLIQSTLAGELSGKARLLYHPDGFICEAEGNLASAAFHI